jgi:hypothetical protein
MGGKMNSDRNTARIVGVLFIIATVASIATIAFVGFLSEPDYLVEVHANEGQVLGGVFVEFIWALAVLGIPVFLYPILKKHSHASALGFYSFRFIEAFLVILYSISLLLLITLSQEYVKAGAPDGSFYQTAGALFLAARDWTFLLGAGLSFTLSALILNYVLWRTSLVPRWLSGWGFLGAALMFGSYLAQFFNFAPPEFLFVPIAVQEMAFALWLIVKGFDPTFLSAQPSQAT